MKRILFTLCILTGSLGWKAAVADGGAFDEGGIFAKENFSATAILRSDYMFRGVSYSEEDPVVQATFDWGYSLPGGGSVFAGIGGSSIAGYNNYNITIYPYIGYANSFGGFNYSILPIWYNYPAAHDNIGETDAGEIYFKVSRGFEAPGSPNIGMFYAFSPDWSYTRWGIAHYFEPSIAFSLPNGFGLSGTIGYQHVDDKVSNRPQSFLNWTVGLSNSFHGFKWDVRYHDTDVNGGSPLVSQYWGMENDLHLFDSRVVFSVSRSF